MTYDVAQCTATGLYWGRKDGTESFCATEPEDAVAFGDQHRSYSDLDTDEEFEWVEFQTTRDE